MTKEEIYNKGYADAVRALTTHIELCREEQEPKTGVLEQIRSKIADLSVYYDNDYFSENKDGMFKCNEVLEIIDKAIKEVSE